MLRNMALVRAFDERMFRAQRQGKTSFYMKSHGRGGGRRSPPPSRSTATTCASRPTASRALLIARGWSAGRHDEPDLFEHGRPAAGQAAADHVFGAASSASSRSPAISTTQYPQAVGWAMARRAKGDTRIAATWCGEGSTAEGDFHSACTFATRLSRAGDLQRRQQPMGDQSASRASPAPRRRPSRRARSAMASPACASTATTRWRSMPRPQWAAERARTNQGPTLIEHFTYRAEGHSTSDDPGAISLAPASRPPGRSAIRSRG